MASVVSNKGRNNEQEQRKWKDKDNNNNITFSQPSQKMNSQTHTNPHNNNNVEGRMVVVPVVYYLSRNGQLEHPHFMEVPLSSAQGLFLRDVMNRLNLLRGKGMAFHYSWSSKRSYKNGYVWHDLEENDFIHPVHGGEYVLKGSEIHETVSSSPVSKSPETSSSSSTKNTPSSNSEFPLKNRRRNQSWGALDLHEYKVYKAESTQDFAGKAAANASTQTDDKRRRRNRVVIKEENEKEEVGGGEKVEELSRDEVSPPPLDSSPETLETLMKADGRLVLATSSSSSLQGVVSHNQGGNELSSSSSLENKRVGYCPSGRTKASSVLMSLISCGSISFRDCGATAVKDHGFNLISHYKMRLPHGENQTVEDDDVNVDVMKEVERNASSRFAKMAMEDKEYFSGSLIETKKDDFPGLKRSSSYNADRSSNMKLAKEEEEGVRAKCIPRRPKTQASTSSKKEHEANKKDDVTIMNTTEHGSRRRDGTLHH